MSAVLEEATELAERARTRIAEIDQYIEQETAAIRALEAERPKVEAILQTIEGLDPKAKAPRSRNGERAEKPKRVVALVAAVSDDQIVASVLPGETASTRTLAQRLGVDPRSISRRLPKIVAEGRLAGDKENGWSLPAESAGSASTDDIEF